MSKFTIYDIRKLNVYIYLYVYVYGEVLHNPDTYMVRQPGFPTKNVLKQQF